jgi:prepilin-type processing-associated H-X9-DG protein
MGRPVRIVEIKDGTSSTLMASEIIQGRNSDLRGFTWWGGSAGFTTYYSPNTNQADVLTGGICDVAATANIQCTTTSTNTASRFISARSFHSPGGVNASMCDGSVRWFNNSIDINIWQALSTSKGGEVMSQTY